MGVRVPGANTAAVVANKGCAEVIAGAGGYEGFRTALSLFINTGSAASTSLEAGGNDC